MSEISLRKFSAVVGDVDYLAEALGLCSGPYPHNLLGPKILPGKAFLPRFSDCDSNQPFKPQRLDFAQQLVRPHSTLANLHRGSPRPFDRDPYVPSCKRPSIAGEFYFIRNPVASFATVDSTPSVRTSDEIASEVVRAEDEEEDANLFVGLPAGSSSSSEFTELARENVASVQSLAGSSTPTHPLAIPGSTAVSSPARAFSPSTKAHGETGAVRVDEDKDWDSNTALRGQEENSDSDTETAVGDGDNSSDTRAISRDEQGYDVDAERVSEGDDDDTASQRLLRKSRETAPTPELRSM